MELSRMRIVLALLFVVVATSILTTTLILSGPSKEVVRLALAAGLIVIGLVSAQIAIRMPSAAELAEMEASAASVEDRHPSVDRQRLSRSAR